MLAGCERYRAITTGHYRKAQGALLVYDITNKESFAHLPYWLKELRDHTDSNIVIALVGNKVDVLFSDPGKREVQKEQAVKFAEQNGLVFTEESSALADINIREIIESVAQTIYEKQEALVKEGKKDPKSLKLTYEEEAQRAEGKDCCV